MTPSRLRGKTVCLITSGHISSNPRVVKEADALTEAGASTVVVALQTLSQLQVFDRDLAQAKNWRYRPVDVSRGAGAWRYRVRAVRERILRLLPPPLWPMPGVVEGAYSRFTSVLALELQREPADIYIAHNLAALPAAAAAAGRTGARLGFDAEDYHAGELPETPGNDIARRRVLAIEDRYLPACRHLTAASPGIAEQYGLRYRRAVTPILNVFPLAERPAGPAAAGTRHSGRPSLYWFSQTIGPGRGLEPMLEILALMRTRPWLQIRGTSAPGFRDRLTEAAERLGVAAQLRFLPRAMPDQMVLLAAGHSLGLSIEVGDAPNRGLCLGNKLFTYLLAGVPVVLSDTRAQQQLAPKLGAAARVINLARTAEAAGTIDDWLAAPGQIEASCREAWRLGERRFNWDLEKEAFLASVDAALAAPG